jgi:hypothetical protein
VKITVELSGGRVITATRPHEGAQAVDTSETCPTCSEPLRAFGGDTAHDYDTYSAAAFCLACRNRIGTIKVKVSTLFGIEEDIAVLNGRCRVY